MVKSKSLCSTSKIKNALNSLTRIFASFKVDDTMKTIVPLPDTTTHFLEVGTAERDIDLASLHTKCKASYCTARTGVWNGLEDGKGMLTGS